MAGNNPGIIYTPQGEELNKWVQEGTHIESVVSEFMRKTPWLDEYTEGEDIPIRAGQMWLVPRSAPADADGLPHDPTGPDDDTNGLDAIEEQDFTQPVYMNSYPVKSNIDSQRSKAQSFMSEFAKKEINLSQSMAKKADLAGMYNLVNPYHSLDTYVTVASGSPLGAIEVRNTAEFDTVFEGGEMKATTATNPHPITIVNGGGLGTVTRDVTAVTYDPADFVAEDGSKPGSLTLDSNVSEIAVGDRVYSDFAMHIYRPNSRGTDHALQSGDILTISMVLNRKAHMVNYGAEPHEDGTIHHVGDPMHLEHLLRSQEFREAYHRQYGNEDFEVGRDLILYGITWRFGSSAPTTVNEQSITVRRSLLTARDVGIKSYYDGEPNQPYLQQLGTHLITFDPETRIKSIIKFPTDDMARWYKLSYEMQVALWAPIDPYIQEGEHPQALRKRALPISTAGG